MATIHDVAARAGVSVATVSHVINASRNVKTETRDRVLAAIADLHYRRDGVARSLRRNKTGTIGVVVADIASSFFAELVRGIESAIQTIDPAFNYILSNTDEDAARERKCIDVLLEKRIDGLILTPAGGNEAYLSDLISRPFPLVFADRAVSGVDADTVAVDNVSASRDIVRHLLDLGHRRIALLKARLPVSSINDRMTGYREALHEAGLPFVPGLVIESGSEVAAAVEAGRVILAIDPLPDAVYCTNDFMTLGMMRAIHDARLNCPRDIAVAAFDDFIWANSFRPQLTAIAQPAFAMGEHAVRLLIDRMGEHRTGHGVHLTLSTEMLVRESCGAHRTIAGGRRNLRKAEEDLASGN
jgi:LacI family transcriptional regulator